MNDDLPEGSVSLEDDAPAPAPAAPVAAESAAPAAPEPIVPAEDHPAEVEAVEVGGAKYVPVAAVIAERKARQTAETQVAELAALRQQLAQQTPYVQFLQAHPELMTPRQPDPVPARQAEPQVDEEALEAARLYDFYKADGSGLDVEKGAKHVAMVRREAQRIAEAQVKPFQQQTAQQKSEYNFQQMLRIKDKAGRSPSQQALRSMWNALDPSLTSDDRVAGMLALAALGADAFQQAPAPQIPIPGPALVTEPSGGANRPAPRMTELESRIARDRGLTSEKWHERTKGFTPRQANTLED